jgi:hypothetical protein
MGTTGLQTAAQTIPLEPRAKSTVGETRGPHQIGEHEPQGRQTEAERTEPETLLAPRGGKGPERRRKRRRRTLATRGKWSRTTGERKWKGKRRRKKMEREDIPSGIDGRERGE